MGVEYTTYLIIGRLCTAEEAKDFCMRLKEMNPDDIDLQTVNSFDSVDMETSLFHTGDIARFPVVCHNYGSAYMGRDEFLSLDEDMYLWYVVERVVYSSSDRWVDQDLVPIKYIEWEKPFDRRHGLLMVHAIN